jgi:hypothetical protein
MQDLVAPLADSLRAALVHLNAIGRSVVAN